MADILVYTPMARQYGPCLATHLRAVWALKEAGHRVEHVMDYWQLDDIESYDSVLAKYAEARRRFLDKEFDLFITVEDDVLLPEDGLVTLVQDRHAAPILYGVYAFRHGLNPRWSAYDSLADEQGISISQIHNRPRYHNAAKAGAIVETAGVGMGCTVFQRAALEVIPFQRRGAAAPDWYFALDAAQRGFKQAHHLGVLCGHFTFEPSPRIYWPDLREPSWVRTEFVDALRD